MIGERSDLLERARELSVLGEWFTAVADGSRGRLALIAGEAGVGKTALLRRFREEHRDGSSGAPASRCSRPAHSGRYSTLAS